MPLKTHSLILTITTISLHTYIPNKYYVQYHTDVKLIFYNMRGLQVYRHDNLLNTSGFHIVKLGDIQGKIGSGQFIYQFNIGTKSVLNTFQIVK